MTSPSLAISPGHPSTHFLSPALPPLDQGSRVGQHWENGGQNAEETCLGGDGRWLMGSEKPVSTPHNGGLGKRIMQSQGPRPQLTLCSIPIRPG